MKKELFCIMATGILLTGCTAPSYLPHGARLVGGGLKIDYTVPTDGTVILVERTSKQIIATKSLRDGNSFEFSPNHAGCIEVMRSFYATTNSMETDGFPPVPTNSHFQLYFVPEKVEK